MNIIEIEKNCLGCAGCVDVFPVDALAISKDENGFYVPSLNQAQCVSCGKCVDVCPALNTAEQKNEPTYYYGWHTDDEIRAASSSGGIFRALADDVLAQGGVVYGAKYSADRRAVVMASTEDCAVEALQKSKYVQANAEGLYRSIRQQLAAGKTVLLTGTPCQIAAARNLFGQHERLLLVDFLCGGVPSPECFAQYVDWLGKKYGSKVKEVDFRNKKNGWSRSTVRVDLFYQTPYMKNAACLDCKFACDRYADITIADFWGFRKAGISNDEKGMSLLVAHTSVGKKLLGDLENVTLFPLDEKDGNYGFAPKTVGSEKRMQREAFLKSFRTDGFEKAAFSGFFRHGRIDVVFRKIKSRLKGLIK